LFGKELHQTYSDVERMPFYEILMILDRFKQDLEKENENNKRQQAESNAQISSIKNQMPTMNDFKTPNFSMPNIPKF
jgi:hypothetical protein